MSDRTAPPPVTDNNPPRRPRPAPPDGGNAVATNVVTNVGNKVPGGPAAQALDALLYGRVDPEQDRAQTGVRLPKYVSDAVRVVAATSRGQATMQDIVTEAVKAYLPAEVLHAAWLRHGGQPAGDDQ